jgi:ribonuclease R
MPIILLKNLCLANRKVAEFIGKQKKTFIYRIHDEPEDKLCNAALISKFGYKIDFNKGLFSSFK